MLLGVDIALQSALGSKASCYIGNNILVGLAAGRQDLEGALDRMASSRSRNSNDKRSKIA